LKSKPIADPNQVMCAGFRDPGGRLFIWNGRVFRAVTGDAFEILQSFLRSSAAKRLLDRGDLVTTRVVGRNESAIRELFAPEAGELLEHQRIPFVSYPYEWPPEMLHKAGELTLKILLEIADENWRLKDATPYNVLFIGPNPVFVDVLSFERRGPCDMVWIASGQFVRTFLLPLLAVKSFGLKPRDLLTTRRDGLQPEDLYNVATNIQKLGYLMLSLVTIPTWLESYPGWRPCLPQARDPGQADFVRRRLVRGLVRKLKSVAPRQASSKWSNYTQTIKDQPYYEAKRSFVRETLDRYSPKTGLVVGCNTGDFTCLAARAGVSMVAIDSDAAVVGETWRRADKDKLDILPLVIDITRPSPSLGWFNDECTSFLSRAHHRFEVVFFLAVMHHIAGDGIPIQEFVRLVRHLTAKLAIVEFIDRNDPNFLNIARHREDIFAPYNIARFEAECAPYFEIAIRRQVRPTRWLYLLRARAS
jgi:SAM-dependent methyltransferase